MSAYWELQYIEVRAAADEVKCDDELWCGKCETLLCDIELGDCLDTLARVAVSHQCPPDRPSRTAWRWLPKVLRTS